MTTKGIAIAQLSGAARKVAEQLDQNPLVARAKVDERSDKHISAAEVKAGLAVIDNFTPEEQQGLKALAMVLGIDVAAAQGPAAAEKTWLPRTPPPHAATELRHAISLGDYVYAQDEGEKQNLVRGTGGILRYAPATDTWTEIHMPVELRPNHQGSYMNPALTSLGDDLVLVGGSGHGGGQAWLYDTSRKEWSRLPPPSTYRENAAVCSVGDKLYAFGGNAGRYATSGADSEAIAKSAEVFDRATGQWSALAIPEGRTEGTAHVLDGKIYLVGGRAADRSSMNQRIDVFDPATGTWQDPPFHLPTSATNLSAWVQDGELHFAGGLANAWSNPTLNQVHEVLSPTTGQVRDAGDIDVPDHANSLQVVNHQGRLFAMGAAGYDDPDKSASFLLEHAVPEEKPAAGGNVITVIQQNHNVDITIHNIITQVQNRVELTHVENTINQIHVENTQVSQAVVDVDVMPLMQNARYSGFFDPDNDFFLRTKAGNKGLLSVGQTSDGAVLVGVASGKSSPAPRNAELFLFHPESDTLVPFSTDAKGQFAVPLPAGLSGEAFVFRMSDGAPSQAASIELP